MAPKTAIPDSPKKRYLMLAAAAFLLTAFFYTNLFYFGQNSDSESVATQTEQVSNSPSNPEGSKTDSTEFRFFNINIVKKALNSFDKFIQIGNRIYNQV